MKCMCPRGPAFCESWSSNEGCLHSEAPKPRTPAEAEALVDALIEEAVSAQHCWDHGDWDKYFEHMKKRDKAETALIAALTGGGR